MRECGRTSHVPCHPHDPPRLLCRRMSARCTESRRPNRGSSAARPHAWRRVPLGASRSARRWGSSTLPPRSSRSRQTSRAARGPRPRRRPPPARTSRVRHQTRTDAAVSPGSEGPSCRWRRRLVGHERDEQTAEHGGACGLCMGRASGGRARAPRCDREAAEDSQRSPITSSARPNASFSLLVRKPRGGCW